MLPQHEFFRDNGFMLVQNVFTPEECLEVTERMFLKCEPPDSMCPKSEGAYALFDDYLYKKKEIFERAIGLELHPTYTYTRLYRPNELLWMHVDRESCEVTASVTISFKGNSIWPIYFLERQKSLEVRDKYIMKNIQYYEVDQNDIQNQIAVTIDAGDAAVFRGMELFHWRREYTQGEWQIQMFLHYVDANGPCKDFKWDKREQLGIKKKGPY
jgi:hypothetical protein